MSVNNESTNFTLPQSTPDIRTLDRFVKITEAARILGYAHFTSIKKLTEEGMLTLYTLPETSRHRILLSELLELKFSQEAPPNSDNESVIGRRKAGRPRKYKGFHS